ncbi:MAG: efflux RND transporter permease subunit [Xanthobacteraceae bacterium]|jgi:multidrug efflux pump subunit AcrB
MGLVKYALKFRVSFYVLSVLILFLGLGAVVVMPKDVFPSVNIPVVTIIWTYTGLTTPEMEKRVTTYSEYSLSNNINGIRNIESQTMYGVSVIKVYFQQDVNLDLAIAQCVASVNWIRAVMPPGIQPPTVVRYYASSVPVIQLALSSDKSSEQELFDHGMYRVRQVLTQLPGATLPIPFGGKLRQIMVDLDQHALQAHGLTPMDVTNAVTAENVVVPSGLVKLGATQYPVRLNSSPDAIEALSRIPVKIVNGAPVLLRDIAYVRDGFAVQQNIVRADGRRSVLQTILKNGNASTLSVVNLVKSMLPQIRAAAPPDMTFTPLFDQSVFVSNAIFDVIREGAIAAVLTGLMILAFLGSWRSTLIVLVSIPLAVLSSLALLAALGETINLMTLGGLALAVGVLVDDATVAIENTYRLFEEGRPFRQAVVEGAAGIAKPTLISTLTICTAFISVVFLTDMAKYLFTPQAMAVVFAMIASYLLSRTLVPILIDAFVHNERHGQPAEPGSPGKPPGLFARLHAGFEDRFERFRRSYVGLLHVILAHRVAAASVVVGLVAGAGLLTAFVGEDYFPQISAGQMRLHVRAPTGMRLEETERLFQSVEDEIRRVIPVRDLELILDNIGMPAINYNLSYDDGSTVAMNDGQILVNLKEEHAPVRDYMRKLRMALREKFPAAIFYFQPADIITQILNFGLPAPIDVQVVGGDADNNRRVALALLERVKAVRGAVDVHLHQIVDAPSFFVNVDRVRAAQVGLTEQQIANGLNTSLSSSFQVSPNFWADPKTGIPYQVAVQTPEYRLSSMSDLDNTPLMLSGRDGSNVEMLSNVATLERQPMQTLITHSNIQRTFDIYANVQDRDLGAIEADLNRILPEFQAKMKPGNRIVLRGQMQSKNDAFFHLGLGLIGALAFVYLLMVVNFQNWGDPFVVLAALPLAFCGIVGSLFITQTTFSIPSLMGAIMSIGVASANSILLVTFAREYREATGCSAAEAAIMAGQTRLRPVLMTAGAMFVGMLPMSLGLADGSEANAALARAVLGGIAVGTCSTLLFVPFLYSVLRRGAVTPLEDYA